MTDAEEKEVLREIRAIKNINKVEITEGKTYIMVKTLENEYERVMPKVENICRRVARGCEVSFTQFVYED